MTNRQMSVKLKKDDQLFDRKTNLKFFKDDQYLIFYHDQNYIK